MKQFKYKEIQSHNTARYYKMSIQEYHKITNHILRTLCTLNERKQKPLDEHHKLLEILNAPCMHHKGKYGTKQSINDVLHGITEKINNVDSNGNLRNCDLTSAQIKNFNDCITLLGKAYGDADALSHMRIEMVAENSEKTVDTTFGNGLFDIQ